MDKVGLAGLLTGHAGAAPWPVRGSGVRDFPPERERRGSGGGGNGLGVSQASSWRKEMAREGQVATRASSPCSAVSVAFHRAAWGHGARKTTGGGATGPAAGPRPVREVSFCPFFF